VFVHTLETIILKDLFKSLTDYGKSISVFGRSACGKSLFVRSILDKAKKKLLLNCNRSLTCEKLLSIINDQACATAEKEEQKIAFPVVIVEDVSMAPDPTGVYQLLKSGLESQNA